MGEVVEIAIKIFQRWKTRKSNYVSQKINAVVIFLEATSPLQITRFKNYLKRKIIFLFNHEELSGADLSVLEKFECLPSN